MVLFKSSASLVIAAIAPAFTAAVVPDTGAGAGPPAAGRTGELPVNLPDAITESLFPSLPGNILASALSLLDLLSGPPVLELRSGELLSEDVLATLVFLASAPNANNTPGFNERRLLIGRDAEVLVDEEPDPVRDNATDPTVDCRRCTTFLAGAGGGPMEPGLPPIEPRRFEAGRPDVVGVPVRGVL
jgi:hypothetical protein